MLNPFRLDVGRTCPLGNAIPPACRGVSEPAFLVFRDYPAMIIAGKQIESLLQKGDQDVDEEDSS